MATIKLYEGEDGQCMMVKRMASEFASACMMFNWAISQCTCGKSAAGGLQLPCPSIGMWESIALYVQAIAEDKDYAEWCVRRVHGLALQPRMALRALAALNLRAAPHSKTDTI